MEVQITIDQNLTQLELPVALEHRLQTLLDRQDRGTLLDEEERREAEGLVEMAEFLSLLRLRAADRGDSA